MKHVGEKVKDKVSETLSNSSLFHKTVNTLVFKDSKAICANGKAIPFELFCEDQGQCPIHTGLTATALKSDCSHISNHVCPVYPLSSKICMDKVNVSLSRYCSPEYGNYFQCQSAGLGLEFEQCYNG